MTQEDAVVSLYGGTVVIDALNVSDWDSPAVYKSLLNGRATAINATIAVWENYRECMDNIAAWLRRSIRRAWRPRTAFPISPWSLPAGDTAVRT